MQDDIIRHLRDDGDPNPTPIDVSQYVIPQGIEIPKPDSIFELSGVPVFTKKSISTLIGKAKSGKTTATAWVVAQCLLGNLKTLWIDTEQGQYYGSRTQYWILSIAGLSSSSNLVYMDLKTLSPTDRSQAIESAIDQYSPDMIIIDGIRDLVFDINSPEESTIVVGQLMKWADQCDVHVLAILHQNKGNDHARGHLGAEMVNKSETVIRVDLDGDRNVVCSPEFTRSEPFPVFAFQRDEYGAPVLIDDYIERVDVGTGRRSVKPTDFTIEEHREYLRVAFGDAIELNYSDLLPALKASFGLHDVLIGNTKTKDFITHCTLINVLKSRKDGKYTFYQISDL